MASPAKNGMPSRQENRTPSPFNAQLRRGGGATQPVTVRDMSSGGLQGTCFNAPAEGEQVTVTFGNRRSVQGVVRWLRKGVFGVEFRNPVDVEMVTDGIDTHPLRRSIDTR